MQNIYEYVQRTTQNVASSMLNIPKRDLDIDIKYSLRKTRYIATCWPNQYKIVYYRHWLEANKHNTRFIDDCITHECAHMVTGPAHDKRFYKLCKKYGAKYEDTYFEDVPYLIRIPEFIYQDKI